MTELCTVKLTPNFERNLDEVEIHLRESDASHAFDALLEDLTDFVVPNLERFPRMGRSFLAHPTRSVEAAQATARLSAELARAAAGAEVREYLMKDYLLLYALIEGTVYLLSLRHHQQLSFDLARHWPE
ncbi:type II toxin-antitoxin system RelE/ParE family toxin [Stenotrophomonas sp. AB1(2024)]|uniref:type II toxin-antitoxin system RelE/ParE family toxin n=1 Tax=Stenotrophomonas sp. AB1(2024) TaxID=3132215 RepID=UPI00309A5A26